MHPTTSYRAFLALGLVGLCAMASRPIAAQTATSSQFRQYKAMNPAIERAFKALKTNRFDEARATLKPCLETIPNHFEAHYILALMDFEARDYQGVIAHLDISEHSLAALNKGYREQVADMKARADANVQEAKDNRDAAASKTKDSTGPKMASLERDVKMAEAEKKPSQGLENPFELPADYLFLRGNTLLRLGRRDEARGAYRKTVEVDATHANAWNNLIALGLAAKDLATTREDLAKAEKAGISIRPELKKAVLAPN